MKNNYQTIMWKGDFLIHFRSMEDAQETIDWHVRCKSAQCLAEIHYATDCLENCGGFIP